MIPFIKDIINDKINDEWISFLIVHGMRNETTLLSLSSYCNNVDATRLLVLSGAIGIYFSFLFFRFFIYLPFLFADTVALAIAASFGYKEVLALLVEAMEERKDGKGEGVNAEKEDRRKRLVEEMIILGKKNVENFMQRVHDDYILFSLAAYYGSLNVLNWMKAHCGSYKLLEPLIIDHSIREKKEDSQYYD